MALVLQITDGTTTVALTSASTTWQLLKYWEPVVATPVGDGSIPDYVTDVLPVIITTANDNAFAAALQDIHSLQRRAAEYWSDTSQTTPVWFQRQLTAETGGTRTLVRSISFDSDAQFGSWIDACPAISNGRIASLAIEHHPYWEPTAATSAAGGTATVLGGEVDYTTTNVAGDVPARLYAMRLYTTDVAAFDRWWIGFRSANRVTTPANYTALWECELGTANDASCVAATDATASPGGAGSTKMTVTFAGATDWLGAVAGRFFVLLNDVSGGNTADFFGRFVVLLRAKVNAGTAQVRLGQFIWPIVENRGVAYGPIVDISATSWTIYNLGTVTFPVRDRKSVDTGVLAATQDHQSGICLRARQKATVATLDCDCFIVIPVDEYFVYTDEANVNNTVTTHETYIGVSPAEQISAANYQTTATTAIESVPPVSHIGAGVPTGDGRLFFCAANVGGVSLDFADVVGVSVQLMNRWISLRGAE